MGRLKERGEKSASPTTSTSNNNNNTSASIPFPLKFLSIPFVRPQPLHSSAASRLTRWLMPFEIVRVALPLLACSSSNAQQSTASSGNPQLNLAHQSRIPRIPRMFFNGAFTCNVEGVCYNTLLCVPVSSSYSLCLLCCTHVHRCFRPSLALRSLLRSHTHTRLVLIHLNRL